MRAGSGVLQCTFTCSLYVFRDSGFIQQRCRNIKVTLTLDSKCEGCMRGWVDDRFLSTTLYQCIHAHKAVLVCWDQPPASVLLHPC